MFGRRKQGRGGRLFLVRMSASAAQPESGRQHTRFIHSTSFRTVTQTFLHVNTGNFLVVYARRLDDNILPAHHADAILDILDHECASTNRDVVSYPDWSEDHRTNTNDHVVSDHWQSLAGTNVATTHAAADARGAEHHHVLP